MNSHVMSWCHFTPKPSSRCVSGDPHSMMQNHPTQLTRRHLYGVKFDLCHTLPGAYSIERALRQSFWMRHFCLQLEASCLQLSFLAYSCVWELFSYSWGKIFYVEAFLTTVELLCLQWESVSKKPLNGLLAKKLHCKQKSSNCKSKKLPPIILDAAVGSRFACTIGGKHYLINSKPIYRSTGNYYILNSENNFNVTIM